MPTKKTKTPKAPKQITTADLHRLNAQAVKGPKGAAAVKAHIAGREEEFKAFILDHLKRQGGAKKVLAAAPGTALADAMRGFINAMPASMRTAPFFKQFGSPLFAEVIRRLEASTPIAVVL